VVTLRLRPIWMSTAAGLCLLVSASSCGAMGSEEMEEGPAVAWDAAIASRSDSIEVSSESGHGSLETLGRASDVGAIVTGATFVQSFDHTAGLPAIDPATGIEAATYTSILLQFSLVEALQGATDKKLMVLVDSASDENKAFHSVPAELYAIWFRRLDGFDLASRPDLADLLAKYPDTLVVSDSIAGVFLVRNDALVPMAGAYRALLASDDVPVEKDGVIISKPPLGSFALSDVRKNAAGWTRQSDVGQIGGADDKTVAEIVDRRCRDKELDSIKLKDSLIAVAEGRGQALAPELRSLAAIVFEPIPESILVDYDLSSDMRLRVEGVNVYLAEANESISAIGDDLSSSGLGGLLDSVATSFVGLDRQLSVIDAPSCHSLMEKLRT
jgi:hypothetical protein